MWRKALDTFETIFVQDEASKQLLSTIGKENVVVAGDTRFDRVAQIAAAAKKIDTIEQFKGQSRLFVAGSTWGPDEDLLVALANDNPSIKFIIAPHEMSEERMSKIESTAKGGAVRYTAYDGNVDCQILILNTMGMLSSVYGYADFSYIGGGFGVGIHNTLEAATFGLPIAFGPNYHKFKEARDMIALGAATSITDYQQLSAWFAPLRDDSDHLSAVSSISKEYTAKNQGATAAFCKQAFGKQ
jgi:3-deoxy-D-manno-octulosonic-acid transferase